MKLSVFIIHILLGIILWGCDSQPIPSPTNNSIGNIQSRGSITASSLSAGSEALFNASGGVSLTNAVFTFNGTQWESDGESLILDTSKETSLTAIYPAKNDLNTLITQDPYIDNALGDVLIAQHTFNSQTKIDLEFQHLFAMLTINVASSINTSLNEIVLETPKVTSINGMLGTFETSTEIKHSTTLPQNTTGVYSFIIPSITNCELKITLNTGETQLSHTLTHDFNRGYKYECNVVDTDNRPGIKDAGELIAFSYLINGKEPPQEYQGYTLDNFGETHNERTTYRLLADITLTEEQSHLLLPIGYNDSKGFQHIFDGEGHTISNLIIPDISINSELYSHIASLFGCIEANGIVKNLHINSAKTTNSPSCNNIGGIATQNHGLIENCSVQNSSFKQTSKAGSICGTLSSTGYIINSYSSNNILEGNEIGGIAGNIAGHIINCYIHNNSFNTTSNSLSGGIAGQSNKGKIYNCYLYQNKEPNYWGAVLGRNNGITMRHFLYNGSKYIVYGKQTTSSNAQIYDTNFKIDGIHISNLLNEWITTTGKTDYPNIPFNTWKVADDGSASF